METINIYVACYYYHIVPLTYGNVIILTIWETKVKTKINLPYEYKGSWASSSEYVIICFPLKYNSFTDVITCSITRLFILNGWFCVVYYASTVIQIFIFRNFFSVLTLHWISNVGVVVLTFLACCKINAIVVAFLIHYSAYTMNGRKQMP